MSFAHKEVSKYMRQCIQHLSKIFSILCKITEESIDNVSTNSEGSSEDISVSSEDEWDDGDTDESTENERNILTIQHLTDDR